MGDNHTPKYSWSVETDTPGQGHPLFIYLLLKKSKFVISGYPNDRFQCKWNPDLEEWSNYEIDMWFIST